MQLTIERSIEPGVAATACAPQSSCVEIWYICCALLYEWSFVAASPADSTIGGTGQGSGAGAEQQKDYIAQLIGIIVTLACYAYTCYCWSLLHLLDQLASFITGMCDMHGLLPR